LDFVSAVTAKSLGFPPVEAAATLLVAAAADDVPNKTSRMDLPLCFEVTGGGFVATEVVVEFDLRPCCLLLPLLWFPEVDAARLSL